MRAALTVALFAALAVACTSSTKRSETLVTEVRGYGDGLRWRKPAQAALRLPPPERDAFLDERMVLDDELRISEFEIRRLSFKDPERTRAEVRVEWTWHMDREGVVHHTITEQDWERRGDDWILVDERLAHGEPMPGVREPAGAPAAEDPAEGELGGATEAPAPGVASPGQAD